jgi:hypothetical protein
MMSLHMHTEMHDMQPSELGISKYRQIQSRNNRVKKEPWTLVDSNEETLADNVNSSVNVSLTLGMGLLISKTSQFSGKTLDNNKIRMVRILNLYI